MKPVWVASVALACACATPLDEGQRLYQEGDRLGALESWRAISDSGTDFQQARARIAVVEMEFQVLVVRYKQRARYFEQRGHLAEATLNYRLALKLQPNDAETLAHVQELARRVVLQKAEVAARYTEAFDNDELARARDELEQLRVLDPFDPELETAERIFGDALQAELSGELVAGRRALAAGNQHAAQAAFRAALELEPSNESAQGYLSYIETIRREAAGDDDEAARFEAPETFASDDAIRAEGFYQNALAAERSGDLYTAIRHDLHALRADVNHERSQAHMARLRVALGHEVDGLIEEGRAAYRDEDLDSALEAWQRALLVDPSNERAKAYVARARRQLQNLERLRSEPDVSEGAP